jgi:acyl-CoA synthetase (AMP-forming)/AMP-acid ligase II
MPIGGPLANLRCYVLDEHLQLLPVGVPGELMVSGIQVARGYIKRPDLTAEKFIANPFARGDLHHSRMYRTGKLGTPFNTHVTNLLGGWLQCCPVHTAAEDCARRRQVIWCAGCRTATWSSWAAWTSRYDRRLPVAALIDAHGLRTGASRPQNT